MPLKKEGPPEGRSHTLQTERLLESLRRFLVRLLEICEEFLPLCDHLEKPSAGMEILLVLLEMSGQPLDLLSEHRDLIFRRTGIRPMTFDLFGHLLLLRMRKRHTRT